jgi:hypothetical protein
MKFRKKTKEENKRLELQICDQLSNFTLSHNDRSEALNVLESDADFKIILETFEGLTLLLKTGIEAKFKNNKNINLSTLKELLNRKIHMVLFGYDHMEETITLQNGDNE